MGCVWAARAPDRRRGHAPVSAAGFFGRAFAFGAALGLAAGLVEGLPFAFFEGGASELEEDAFAGLDDVFLDEDEIGPSSEEETRSTTSRSRLADMVCRFGVSGGAGGVVSPKFGPVPKSNLGLFVFLRAASAARCVQCSYESNECALCACDMMAKSNRQREAF